MHNLTYVLILVMSFLGMLLIDRHYKLAFWFDAKRTWLTLAICTPLFIVWDLVGINLGIFLHGNSAYDTDIMLAPHFSIEELLFLAFFVYCSLVVIRFVETKWRRI